MKQTEGQGDRNDAGPVYRGFRPRPYPPDLKLFHGYMAVIPVVDREDFAALHSSFDEQFNGITTDGAVREEVFALADEPGGSSTIAAAARDFLDTLEFDDQRTGAREPLDSPHRLRWTNAFATWIPSGVLLDDLTPSQRDAAMRVVRSTLSDRGYAEVRQLMALNEALGDFIRLYRETLREWIYWFTVFGEPSDTEPWGWQLMGHHVVLNCLVIGDQVVLGPTFLGAEMVEMDEGAMAGVAAALQDEHRAGTAVVRSLTPQQQAVAVLHRSMRTDDLPEELRGRVEGRHRAGAGRNNLVLPYQGLAASELSSEQRELLLALIDVYVGRVAEPQRTRDTDEVARHLDETHFAWIGDPDADGPFYYRVHSPVVLIEFDHHAGIFLASEEPQPFHIHTIVRKPNGGDYGVALLRQHDARVSARG
ncbi:MAG: DUF3500 domain-containing protein [Solirubrobacteraceae bacterium]